jgi:hypothetical protein
MEPFQNKFLQDKEPQANEEKVWNPREFQSELHGKHYIKFNDFGTILPYVVDAELASEIDVIKYDLHKKEIDEHKNDPNSVGLYLIIEGEQNQIKTAMLFVSVEFFMHCYGSVIMINKLWYFLSPTHNVKIKINLESKLVKKIFNEDQIKQLSQQILTERKMVSCESVNLEQSILFVTGIKLISELDDFERNSELAQSILNVNKEDGDGVFLSVDQTKMFGNLYLTFAQLFKLYELFTVDGNIILSNLKYKTNLLIDVDSKFMKFLTRNDKYNMIDKLLQFSKNIKEFLTDIQKTKYCVIKDYLVLQECSTFEEAKQIKDQFKIDENIIISYPLGSEILGEEYKNEIVLL